ncbi:thioredoxin [Nocardia sp. 2]|uniref:Thioredoxin n=1 Tax=Nocardia acididurans TaxID=2802282 RepID=A0ABS1M3I4_9NOCA|nr:thioredoxin [Nocardia acididurans]MBL1075227.1 thioredoxin [Nocardia acididurans]
MSTEQITAEVAVVTDENFAREVLEQELPVLVDFWAEWCPPCRMIAPVLGEIAREKTGEFLIRKLDADENPLTAREYKVLSMPTLILFRNGVPVRTIVGARPKVRLLAELNAALSE